MGICAGTGISKPAFPDTSRIRPLHDADLSCCACTGPSGDGRRRF